MVIGRRDRRVVNLVEDRRIDRKVEREVEREIDRKADRKANRKVDREADREAVDRRIEVVHRRMIVVIESIIIRPEISKIERLKKRKDLK